jgi:hypothetical protein
MTSKDAVEGFPVGLIVSSADWPDPKVELKPGDLRYFVPQGFGMGAPMIITPYGGPPSPTYYGLQDPQVHPMLNAPVTDSRGGTVYFDDGIDEMTLNALLGGIGVFEGASNYAAFVASSADPQKERYLDQLRIVSSGALQALFACELKEPMPTQPLTVGQAIASFVQRQKEKWNKGSWTFPSSLAGTAGGDGDWAKESLAFGLTVENTYWGVYRVWSRSWLVTK